jgi:hypothetical protein
MKKISIILIVLLITSCTSNKKDLDKISDKIYSQLKESQWKTIDFSKTVPFNFDKVCIFGPYSSNKDAEKALGFYWNMELRTLISTHEGINIITFIKNNEVISYIEHPRNKGDFWRLSGKCLDYNTKLKRTTKEDKWIIHN